jgi:hypothetical protein
VDTRGFGRGQRQPATGQRGMIMRTFYVISVILLYK